METLPATHQVEQVPSKWVMHEPSKCIEVSHVGVKVEGRRPAQNGPGTEIIGKGVGGTSVNIHSSSHAPWIGVVAV